MSNRLSKADVAERRSTYQAFKIEQLFGTTVREQFIFYSLPLGLPLDNTQCPFFFELFTRPSH